MRPALVAFVFGFQALVGAASAQPTAGPSDLRLSPPPPPASSAPATATQAAAEPAYPRVEFGGRVITGWERERSEPATGEATVAKQFFLDQARVKLRAQMHKRLRASLSVDLEQAEVRNAFIGVRFSRALRLKLGRFKRPFSGLELTGAGDLPFRGRGLFNRALVENANWGDRAVGGMFWGKLKRPRLRWYAAVMSSVPLGSPSEGVDVLGRVTYAPIKALRVGLNGGHKFVRPVFGPTQHLNAVGGDLQLKAAGLWALLELDAAQNPNPPPVAVADREPHPMALGLVGFVGYSLALSPEIALQPVVSGEWADTDTEFSQDEAARLVVGVNLLLWDSLLRVMPQLQVVRPLGSAGPRSEPASESLVLAFAAEI